jgi:hypothetical protein
MLPVPAAVLWTRGVECVCVVVVVVAGKELIVACMNDHLVTVAARAQREEN